MIDGSNGVQALGGRERLMMAAHKHFPHAGYSSVSVSQLLDASSLKAPSLYHHFGDKEGLYVAWAVDSLARLGENLEEVASTDGSVKGRLERLLSVFLSPDSPDLLQMMRDLRDLRAELSQSRLRGELEKCAYDPVERVFLKVSGDADEAARLAHLFVHSAMCLHPHYTPNAATRAVEREWLADHFAGARQAAAS